MNVERFQADLARAAALAEPVDLRDRVLAGSRRRARRRTIVASAAVAITVLGITGVAFTLVPRGSMVVPSTSTPPAATTTPSAVAPPSTVSSSPAAPPSASFPPAKYKIGTWSTSNKATLPGTLHYLTGSTTLNVLGAGKLRTATLQGTITEYDCARQSIVFSPDGQRVAWVEGDNERLQGGKLVVATLTGGTAHVVFTGPVRCDGGYGPKWMPDAQRLVVSRADGTVQLVDVTTGKATAAPTTAWGDYLAWSANGTYVAYGEQGKIVVAKASGAVVKRLPYDIGCCTGGFSVQGVSNDGRYVGVSFMNSDPSTVHGAMKIVDLTTGKEASAASTEYLLAGDLRLVAVRGGATMSVDLEDASGKKLASTQLPSAAQPRLYLP